MGKQTDQTIETLFFQRFMQMAKGKREGLLIALRLIHDHVDQSPQQIPTNEGDDL